MGSKKIHVFLVKSTTDDPAMPLTANRLIRGTLKDVEAKLRGEVSIEPCTAEQAHDMADVEIEESGEFGVEAIK